MKNPFAIIAGDLFILGAYLDLRSLSSSLASRSALRAIGTLALGAIIQDQNVAFGYQTLADNTTGIYNTGVVLFNHINRLTLYQ